MDARFVDIHTHRPTGRELTPRTAGVHPWNADKGGMDRLSGETHGLTGTNEHPVQAIGEIGLDTVRGPHRAVQLSVLRSWLALAHEHGLPVVLHCVRAFEPMMLELAMCEPRAVIFHGFIGSSEQARRAVAKGYYLSFGARAFASPKTVEVLRAVPLAQLFLETDDSCVAIEAIYARAATVKGVSVEELKRATLENYERIFGKQHE